MKQQLFKIGDEVLPINYNKNLIGLRPVTNTYYSEESNIQFIKVLGSNKLIHSSKFVEKTLLTNIVEERLTLDVLDNKLKRETRWIAISSKTPIVNTIWGAYINPTCLVHEAYTQKFIKDLN